MKPLVVACGALASELRAVLSANGLTERVEVRYLPANLHNRPERIVPALETLLAVEGALQPDTGELERPVVVGYADCGTAGALDAFLADHPGATRLDGAHCYEMFAGSELFAELHHDEPGTFYLTDFLAKHFDALVWSGLGLDRHPELRDTYFGNYQRVVFISQVDEPTTAAAARAAAEQLGLAFEHRHVGLDPFAATIATAVSVTVRSGA